MCIRDSYVTQLATLFHKFYNACRVKGEDEALTQARLAPVSYTHLDVYKRQKMNSPTTTITPITIPKFFVVCFGEGQVIFLSSPLHALRYLKSF